MKNLSGHSPEILDSSEKLGKKNPQPKKGKGNKKALNLSVHEEFENYLSGKVFWLPEQPTPPTFPFDCEQWHQRVSFPVTAAGPRRICTVFPFPNNQVLNYELTNIRKQDFVK